MARRWLGLWLAGAALLLALPVAAPLLAAAGWPRAAAVLYAAFRPMCHQLPHHSWFLGGPAASYGLADVQAALGPAAQAAQAFHQPIAGGTLGYQLAVCQRDLATYAGLFAASVLYALGAAGRPLGWRGYAACLVPISLDGLTQLVGLRESTPLLRSMTGGLFGAATALFVLPQIGALCREWLEVADWTPDDGRVAVVARGGGGLGVVAAASFTRGAHILEVSGEHMARPGRHTLQVAKDAHLAAPAGLGLAVPGLASWRYLDHACEPNAWLDGTRLVALRDIAAGEPIAFDYETTEWELAEPFQCACGRCGGRMVRGFRFLSAAERAAREPYLAEHLRVRLGAGDRA